MSSLLYKAAGDNSANDALKGGLYGLGGAGIFAAGHIGTNHLLAQESLRMGLNDLYDRRNAVRSWKDKGLAKEYVNKAHSRVQEAAKDVFRKGNRLNVLKNYIKSPYGALVSAGLIGAGILGGMTHNK